MHTSFIYSNVFNNKHNMSPLNYYDHITDHHGSSLMPVTQSINDVTWSNALRCPFTPCPCFTPSCSRANRLGMDNQGVQQRSALIK